ncbi:WD40-repeat-containing domain protein [Aspergillus granulosus]|uniref:WD40-repeat-containing domain protein n=1 Tax=Aspergillus granulosus TaxID=176169 RepID=A0ABR4HAH7_9EURO
MIVGPALEEYQIGWICALPIEAAAAEEMLDEKFGMLEEQDNADTNIYTLGRIGKHYVVIACLGGEYGTVSAATVANNMMRTFSKSLRVGLMVGIGGGAPSLTHDIRLGDIVVSFPTGTCGGVLQHDMGKFSEDGKLRRTGSLNSPPRLLLAAVNKMRAAEITSDPCYPSYIDKVVQKNARTRRNFRRPDSDRLFQIQYDHHPDAATCDGCLAEWEVERDEREDHEPRPHYGVIASGNAVIKNGKIREQLQKETCALCFEMEAAGLMQDFPCIVIRGICDYADSHKNKQWQGYAALVAAAYAKELLGHVPRAPLSQESLIADICKSLVGELRVLGGTTKYVEQKIDLEKLKIAKGAAFNSYGNQHDECLPGTRVELLREIEEWAISPDGKCIFWLNGMAGTGKSTISRTVASRFKEKGLLGASFFFKRGEEGRGSARHLFPTLVAQLVKSFPGLIPFVQKTINDDPQISDHTLGEQFKKLLLQPLLEVKQGPAATVAIVIDALDECEETDVQLILRLLPQVKRSSVFRLRFLLTSRPELPIRLGFKNIDHDHQDLVLHETPMPTIEHDISLFLQHRILEITQKRALPPDWPGVDHITTLVTMSVPLFIFAATVCRILEDPQWPPEDSLGEILSHKNDKSSFGGTYLPVLERLLTNQNGEYKTKLIREYRMLIGTVLILETPLPAVSLSRLTGIQEKSIAIRLDSLHSVLSVPVDETKPVRLFHLSFRDFLLDPDTHDKTPFGINEKDMHRILANQCLELMHRSLRKNICNFRGDCTLRSEISKYDINHHLPLELQYACRYWAQHLVKSNDPVAESVRAFSFLQVHFLHWVEAMSVLGIVSDVVGVIKILQSVDEKNPGISEFLYDASRFILKIRQIADTAPLQIYSSGLVFAPSNSLIKRMFNEEAPKWLCKWPNVEETWGAELQTLIGHSNTVSSLAFSPNGQLLASGSFDKTVKLWDLSTGQLCQTLVGHSGYVVSLAFSPNGQLLASSARTDIWNTDKTIKLWDLSTGELQQILEGDSEGNSEGVQTVAFSPDGKLLASCSNGNTIKLWGPTTSEEWMQTLELHSRNVWSVAFLSDGKLLAYSSRNATIDIWDPLMGKLQQTLEIHSEYVCSVAVSANGKLLASGCEGATIKLWDLPTGELQQTLEGHSKDVETVAFSPDGTLLASGSKDKTIKLWALSTGQVWKTLERHSDWVCAVAFSPDGQLLSSSSWDNTIKLWDPTADELQHTFLAHSNKVQTVAFSPDGQQFASGSEDQTIKLWDPSTGELCQTLDVNTSVHSVAFSPDGQLLASGSENCTVRLWDPSTGELWETLVAHTDGVISVAFSPDGQLLASGSRDATVKLWDPSAGELQQTLEGHNNNVWSVTFSPDGKLLASCADGDIKFWSPTIGELWRQTFQLDSSGVRSVVFSPDGQLLASSSSDYTINLWNLSTGELQETLQGHSGSVESLAFSPDGRLLASGSKDWTIKLWDLFTGELQQTLEGHTDKVQTVAFSPDGELLASGSGDATVKLWDPFTGELQQNLEGHSDKVWTVAFSPDGELLASGSGDTTVKLWDPFTGELWQTLEGDSWRGQSVTFSPDGELLASSSSYDIELWDPSTGELQQTIQGHFDTVQTVAFSPDGQLLASGSEDRTIKLWDPFTGKLQQTLEGHDDMVQAVAFSRDGKLLASCSNDNTIKLWGATTGEVWRETLDVYTRYSWSVAFSPDGKLLASEGENTIELWDPFTGELKRTMEGHSNLIWQGNNVEISILENQWLCLQGEKILWLPSDYRPVCLDIKGDSLALGHASGGVSFTSGLPNQRQ